MQLSGHAAVVTGSSSGVGRATALALARLGCRVVVHCRQSRAEADEVAREIEHLGSAAVVVAGDVAEDEVCRQLVAAADSAWGRLDILVNCAGTTRFIPHGSLEKVTTEDWDRILAVNLRGTFQCCRAAQEPMLAAGGGAIVNVASIAGVHGTGSSIPYAASKGAVITLTKSLARALAPKIRVNAVAPGFIAGRWLEEGLGRRYAAIKARHEERLPLGRVSEAEDVADVIVSLAAGSRQVTGQTIVVDGGASILDPLSL